MDTLNTTETKSDDFLKQVGRAVMTFITIPITAFINMLVLLTAHSVYHPACWLAMLGSVLLGVATYWVWGGDIPTWHLLLVAFIFPLVWSQLLFGRLIPPPWGSLGFQFPDSPLAYWGSLAYAVIGNVPATVPVIWLLTRFVVWAFPVIPWALHMVW